MAEIEYKEAREIERGDKVRGAQGEAVITVSRIELKPGGYCFYDASEDWLLVGKDHIFSRREAADAWA